MTPKIYSLLFFLSVASLVRAAPVELAPFGRFDSPLIDESSGIVKSRVFPDTYWTHNDSGDKARIFAVRRDGSLIAEIPVSGGANRDWEDIAADGEGFLYIGSFGNNENKRRDLAVYKIAEPNPVETSKARVWEKIRFRFPDQSKFPPVKRNFDCESLFHANGKLYFITKHRSDSFATLYRLDSDGGEAEQVLTLIQNFNTRHMATGADALPDGSKLAVITYRGLWVFEKPEGSDNYFAGRAFYKQFSAQQCEAVCWDDPDTLIVTNEQGELFAVKVAELVEQ